MPDPTLTIMTWGRTFDGGYLLQVAVAPCSPLEFHALSSMSASELVYDADAETATVTVEYGVIPFKDPPSHDDDAPSDSGPAAPEPAMSEEDWIDQQRVETRRNIEAALALAPTSADSDQPVTEMLPGVGEEL